MADDAEVVRGLAEAGLVFQGDGDLPGFLVPGAGFGQTASVPFDDAEGVVGSPHRSLIARRLKTLQRLLVEGDGFG